MTNSAAARSNGSHDSNGLAGSAGSALPADVFSARRGPSRRTIVTGAAWAVPVIALAVGVPALASSLGPISRIQVTLSPTPPVAGSPLRLTYSGTNADLDPVPFPAGATATVVLSGGFTISRTSGVSLVTTSGSDPVTNTYTITTLASFFIQGTPVSGTNILVTVLDSSNNVIGSDSTTVS